MERDIRGEADNSPYIYVDNGHIYRLVDIEYPSFVTLVTLLSSISSVYCHHGAHSIKEICLSQ